MHATITNLGTADVPVIVWVGSAPTAPTGMLLPGASATVNDPAVGRVDVGNNPTWAQELSAALGSIVGALRRAVEAILAWLAGQPQPRGAPAQVLINVRVENHARGQNQGIRALAGSNLDESEVPAGATRDITAPGATPGSGAYVELRQLGMAPAVDAPMPGSGAP